MKLTNQQIAALVDEIYNANENVRKKEIKDEQNQQMSHIRRCAGRYAHLINQIPTDILKMAYLENWTKSSAFVRTMLNEIKPTTKQISKSEITRKIILASIDANDLDELKRKLKITF